MADALERGGAPGGTRVPWSGLGAALGLAVAGTAVLGGATFTALEQNVWWIGLAGALSTLGAGGYLGWRARDPEPLLGTLLAVLYVGVVIAVLFGGTVVEAFPEPLPGLGKGDSTFFFVWPLLVLAAGVAGCVVGGRVATRGRPAGRLPRTHT